MMIATTMNAAVSERARSNVFKRGFAVGASSRGMTQLPLTQLLPGPAFFGKDQPLTVRNAPKQACFFERVGSLRTGRHPARFLKGLRRACILDASGEVSCFTNVANAAFQSRRHGHTLTIANCITQFSFEAEGLVHPVEARHRHQERPPRRQRRRDRRP
jgi:hypothetical protein